MRGSTYQIGSAKQEGVGGGEVMGGVGVVMCVREGELACGEF